jgi:hypothetical protein
MPEHCEVDQVANFSINIRRRAKTPQSEDEEVVVGEENVDEENLNEENFDEENIDENDEIKDIGELLGFRITGGRDFFMPITIFHVDISNTCR